MYKKFLLVYQLQFSSLNIRENELVEMIASIVQDYVLSHLLELVNSLVASQNSALMALLALQSTFLFGPVVPTTPQNTLLLVLLIDLLVSQSIFSVRLIALAARQNALLLALLIVLFVSQSAFLVEFVALATLSNALLLALLAP